MRFIQRIAVVALALATSACASTWVKPGSTEQDLATDQSVCERAAENAYAGAMDRGLQSWTTALDKRGYFERCMIARGWGTKA